MRPLRLPAPPWVIAGLGGVTVVATGLLPVDVARASIARLAPVLVFLVAVTALAGVADAAGVFDAAAVRAARLAGGRTPVLFALVVVLAVATTVLLSLDTTAVLLTPVVLTLALRLDLPPWPFALVTVWLANAGSLLLPVSNLTNLLVAGRLDVEVLTYAGRFAAPALVAIVVPVAVVALLDGRALRGRYPVLHPVAPSDRVLFRVSVVVLSALAVAVLAGLPIAGTTAVLAVVLVAVCAVRRPRVLRPSLVPWRLLPLVLGLLLVVEAAGPHGLDAFLRSATGPAADPLRVSAVAAAGGNLVNNLPAFLAIERITPDQGLPALLVGVNVGPLLTPWASLATLLWADRCRAAGLTVPWWSFVRRGLVLVPVLLVGCTAAIRLSGS